MGFGVEGLLLREGFEIAVVEDRVDPEPRHQRLYWGVPIQYGHLFYIFGQIFDQYGLIDLTNAVKCTDIVVFLPVRARA